MKKIGWIQIPSLRYGGVVYAEKVREVLSRNFDFSLENIEAKYLKWRYLKPIEWFFNIFKIKEKKDLWIRDSEFSSVTLPLEKRRGKNMVLVYHVDFSTFPLFLKPWLFMIENLFYASLKKADVIVTISEYWKNYFLEKGYKNVQKIYYGFDLDKFNVSDSEVSDFKKRFNLEGKNIIYLGNCQKAKGVEEAYRVLKDLDAILVTSGEPLVKIPALNLNLKYRDYLCLLKASSAVVTMSKFREGWCITAQEAMFLKTPVVGSGLGGMKELLEGGGQIVCQDFNSLREKVEHILNNPETGKKMGESGREFAVKFTVEKFNKDWLNLVKNICAE